MAILLLLAGCRRAYQPSADFALIARDAASGRAYYYNPQSLKRDKGYVTFDYLQVESSGERVEGRMQTNCEEQAQRLSGAYYAPNGALWMRMPPDAKPTPAPPGSDYARMIARPCRQSAERIRFAGEYSVPAAMRALYGSYNEKDQSSLWSEAEAEAAGLDIAPPQPRVEVLFDLPYAERGVAKHMLLVSADGAGCHICTAPVGVFVFEQMGGEWRLEVERHNLAVGSNGLPPDGMKLLQIGPDVHALYVPEPYVMTGEKTLTENLYLPGEAGLPLVFSSQTLDDDREGLCADQPQQFGPCSFDKASWRLQAGGNADYYDIVVERAKAIVGQPEQRSREHYVFSDGAYRRVNF